MQSDRYLTQGECQLARSVFGEQIELTQVQIRTRWWVLPGYAISPNGHIYFNIRDVHTDFSQAPLGTRAWLIHELTHVWQYQRGIQVVRGALFNRRYRYVLALGRDFLKYGIEQQAQMVQDYYMQREQGADCSTFEQCIPFVVPLSVTT